MESGLNGTCDDDDDQSEIYYRLIDNYTVWRLETVEAVEPELKKFAAKETNHSYSPMSPFLRLQEVQALQIKSSRSPDVPVHKKRNLIKNLEGLIEELQEKVTRIQTEVDAQDIASTLIPLNSTTTSRTKDIKEKSLITVNGDSTGSCDPSDCHHMRELKTLKIQSEKLFKEKNHLEEQIVQLRLDKSVDHGTDSEKRVKKLETENLLLQEKLKGAMERLSQMNRDKCADVANRFNRNPVENGEGGTEENRAANVAARVNQYEAVKSNIEARFSDVVQRIQERHNLTLSTRMGTPAAPQPQAENHFKSLAIRQLTDANSVTQRLSEECKDIRKDCSDLQDWMSAQLSQVKEALIKIISSGRTLPKSKDKTNTSEKLLVSVTDIKPELNCLNALQNLIEISERNYANTETAVTIDTKADTKICLNTKEDIESETRTATNTDVTTNSYSSAEEIDLKSVEKDLVELKKRLTDGKGNINVVGRIRPLIKDDGGGDSVISYDESKGATLEVTYRGRLKMFELDSVFGSSTSQEDVMNSVKSEVLSCLDGRNSSIFVYGHTGSGKTYTIQGVHSQAENVGLMKRSLVMLLNEAEQRSNDSCYTITVSIVEIRNEIIKDLLSSDPNNNKLDIKSTSDGGVSLPGLVQSPIKSLQDFDKIWNLGQSKRSAGSANSSHHVVTFSVSASSNSKKLSIIGKLNLIDLAGSERVEKTAVDAAKFKESQLVNKSLTSLGDVISALNAKQSHIPHRSSKLTNFLQDSLTSRSQILVIVQLSPAEKHSSETISSLMFAQRIRTADTSLQTRQDGHDSSGKSTPAEPALIRPRRPSTSGLVLLSGGERRSSIDSERRSSVTPIATPTRRPPMSVKMSMASDRNDVKVDGRNGSHNLSSKSSTTLRSVTPRR